MSKKQILALIIFSITLLTSFTSAAIKINLNGKDSPHSASLAAFFEGRKYLNSPITEHPSVTCISTANDPLYVGLEQSFIIHAPAEKVIAIIDDFPRYPHLFKDIVRAEVIKKESDTNFILRQELKMPIPFLPHLIFDMSYFASRNNDGKQYIYKLCGGKDMKFNDGMISITRKNSESCYFYELDFIYGNWSALGKLSNKIIWEEVAKSNVEANLIFKVKAEHPDWDLKKVIKEAKQVNESVNYSIHVQNKTTSDLFFKKRN